jgi:hypothetical protein
MPSSLRASARLQRRTGCLGCLGRLALILAGGVVAGAVLLVAIDHVFVPWAFYLGGTRHVLPVWQGIGRMRGPGGDYIVSLWISPARPDRTFHLPSVDGQAYLCTPRGDRFLQRATGYFTSKIGADTDGKQMEFELRRRPLLWRVIGGDERPCVDLRGTWRNSNLELDDDGSLSRAFLPDGMLNTGPPRNQPRTRAHASLVLHEIPFSWRLADCRASDR